MMRCRLPERCAETGAILLPGHFMAPYAERIDATAGGFKVRSICDTGSGVSKS